MPPGTQTVAKQGTCCLFLRRNNASWFPAGVCTRVCQNHYHSKSNGDLSQWRKSGPHCGNFTRIYFDMQQRRSLSASARQEFEDTVQQNQEGFSEQENHQDDPTPSSRNSVSNTTESDSTDNSSGITPMDRPQEPTLNDVQSVLQKRAILRKQRQQTIQKIIWDMLLEHTIQESRPLEPMSPFLNQVRERIRDEVRVMYSVYKVRHWIKATERLQNKRYWEEIQGFVNDVMEKRRQFYLLRENRAGKLVDDNSSNTADVDSSSQPTQQNISLSQLSFDPVAGKYFHLGKEDFIAKLTLALKQDMHIPARRVYVSHAVEQCRKFDFQEQRELVKELIFQFVRVHRVWHLVLPAVRQDLVARFLFNRIDVYNCEQHFETLLQDIRESMIQTCDMTEARRFLLQEMKPEERTNLERFKDKLLRKYVNIPYDKRLEKLLNYVQHEREIIELLGSGMTVHQVHEELKARTIDVSRHYVSLLEKEKRNAKLK